MTLVARTGTLPPLMANEALDIALFIYEDGILWGFNSDGDALRDLHDFAESIPLGFEAPARAAASA